MSLYASSTWWLSIYFSFAPFKMIQNSRGLWNPRCGFQIPDPPLQISFQYILVGFRIQTHGYWIFRITLHKPTSRKVFLFVNFNIISHHNHIIFLFISIELKWKGRIPDVIPIESIHPQQGQTTHRELHALGALTTTYFSNKEDYSSRSNKVDKDKKSIAESVECGTNRSPKQSVSRFAPRALGLTGTYKSRDIVL